MSIKSHIRTIKNYPIKGVMFRDITTLLNNSAFLSFSFFDISLIKLNNLKCSIIL